MIPREMLGGKNSFIFTNNHYRGAAIQTANTLKDMLEKVGQRVH